MESLAVPFHYDYMLRAMWVSALIGGVRITVGDEVLDTSVRAKLQKMYTALVA
jgi:hypothetical protein